MKKHLLLVLAILTLTPAARLAAFDLIASPKTPMQGIPVTLMLTGSDLSRVRDDQYVALHVTRGADQFYATTGARGVDEPSHLIPVKSWLHALDRKDALVLEPGPLLNGVRWMEDHELAKPGSYTLRIVVLEEARFDFRSGTLDVPGMVAVSSPMSFEVREPTGADKEAWDFYMQSNPNPEKHSIWLLQTKASSVVWERFPDSEYARHIAPIVSLGKSGPEGVAFYDQALKRALDPICQDVIEFKLAATLGSMGENAIPAGKDLNAAIQNVADARIRLERLAASTKSPKVKQLAEEQLLSVPTPEKLAARAQGTSTRP